MQVCMVKMLPIAFCGLFLIHVSMAHAAATPNKQTDLLQTSKGPLRITPLYHGSVMFEFDGKVIHIDPWSQADYTGIPQADFILITHSHADHMDAAITNKLKKPTTVILSPPAVADTLNGACGIVESIANGEKKMLAGIGVEAVPMYNLVRGSEPGNPFHHKGIGNGYILTFGDKRVYISGDTEFIPEMRPLENIAVAFICMNPPRTMSTAEAADAVKAFRPGIVYPYHYRGQNPQEFADALKGTAGVEVRVRKLEGEP